MEFSLVHYLEELVAQLELERGRLARNRPGPEGTSSQSNDIQPDQSLFSVETESEDHLKSAYKLAAITAKESALACSLWNRPRHVLPYHKAFFMNAELPFPLAFGSHRTIDVPNPSNGSSFTQLPDEVADKLMAVYLNRISPQYPIFSREDVDDIFQRFKLSANDPQMVTPDERFIIWIIMAIAVLSSTADDYRKLASVAESLRRNAFSHFEFGLRSNHGTTTTIRQLLLLLQYGFLLPSSTNLWQVAGDAMRIAVGLGLHEDTPAESGFDEETAHSRKKLFWTVSEFLIAHLVTLLIHFIRSSTLLKDQSPSRPTVLTPLPGTKFTRLFLILKTFRVHQTRQLGRHRISDSSIAWNFFEYSRKYAR